MPSAARPAASASRRATTGYPKPIQCLARTWLLILDDRYARRGTLLASQIPVDRWHDIGGDPTSRETILDRLLNNRPPYHPQGWLDEAALRLDEHPNPAPSMDLGSVESPTAPRCGRVRERV